MDKATFGKVIEGKHKGLSGRVITWERSNRIKMETFIDGKRYRFHVKPNEVRIIESRI